MTTRRAYRPALPFERAWEEILRCRSSQFDPALVDRFEQLGPDEWFRVVGRVQRAAESPSPCEGLTALA
jgi:hypothetical protein